ncbi:GtrA family protein [Anaerovorax odorimutans]|uniref:GtrA family protein n=1 Tax=Anaerovorax odorimutans TaxID=109327 RepID=A0ABT1RJB0_9FIRM|nr:GtrA family protein [Anaerovorax odorimutans]MCQ4635271.1 GtrA family protein [Anaerovorax odorimutans]
MFKKLIDIKLAKFIIVGIINTIVGTAIMFGLYNFAGCSYWVSSAANYILTSILSFFLNKHFTFQHKGSTIKSAARFTVNIAICYLLAYGIAKPAVLCFLSGQPKAIQENIAMLAGMCLFVGFNYLGQRFFAFKEE